MPTEPVQISPTVEAVMTELAKAMQHFELLIRRPRKANAWSFIECRLWNARAAALAAGVLNRGSERYRQVSGRLHEASLRRQRSTSIESATHPSR